MVPQKILERLNDVRARKLSVNLAWGIARGVALAAGVMIAACLLDWIIDLWVETPGVLRWFMFLGQLALWGVSAWLLVLIPLLIRRSDKSMALWCEEHFPFLGFRLITAVELNRPEAKTEGMSTELIGAVTRQAEDTAGTEDFSRKVDRRPIGWAAMLLGGVAAVVIVLFLSMPATAGALLARQFLADREIPRSVRLARAGEEDPMIRPKGEEVVLLFHATGEVADDTLRGEVRIDPEDDSSEYYPLVFDSRTAPGDALFKAVVPPSIANSFSYRAWLGDGRTRRDSHVRYVPRPVVTRLEAWVILPEYCGLRPDGKRYEQHRPRGELAGPRRSSARILVGTQKPIAKGTLEFMLRPPPGAREEKVSRSVKLSIAENGMTGEAVFDLRQEEITYRVVVEDEFGFNNTHPPRRGMAILPDEPPRVTLLPERFPPSGSAAIPEESEVEGIPIPLGEKIRISYYCAHPYGLARARLAYRVLKGALVSKEEAAPETPWKFLPLGEVTETKESGPFDPRRGAFRYSGLLDQVEFHPIPSPDPERIHGRTEGGGRFDFRTSALPDVEPGDQLEFYVEVFASNPDLDQFPGRSETRSKTFVTRPDFMAWILETLKHESRIRSLEAKQRGVFTPAGTERD